MPESMAMLRHKALVESMGFPVDGDGGGFEITGSLVPPKNTEINYDGISQKFSALGLVCSNNTPANVRANTNAVVRSLPNIGKSLNNTYTGLPDRSPATVLAAMSMPSKFAEKKKDYQWQADSLNSLNSQIQLMLTKYQLIKDKNLYYVSEHTVDNSFESSTVRSIVEVFKAAGNIIGHVQGNHVDPEQLGAQIGDILNNLSETQGIDFDEQNQGIMFLTAPAQEGSDGKKTTPAIAGVSWQYHFTLHDYKDKKGEKHKSTYKIKQHSLVFTNLDILYKVYNEVLKG